MRIHLISDIHLDRGKYSLSPGDADVIVVAGDLAEDQSGIDWLEEAYANNSAPIIYVPGNHDFYGDIDLRLQRLTSECARIGVDFLYNKSVVIGGVKFIGSTLWTDFASEGDQRNAMIKAHSMQSDFRHITEGGFNLRPSRILDEHNQALAFIKSELEATTIPCVVVTHHAPSKLSNQYSDLPWRQYYCSNLDRFITYHEPVLWLHGHLHEPVDYVLGKTRVVSNPRGYFGIDYFSNFDPNKIISI